MKVAEDLWNVSQQLDEAGLQQYLNESVVHLLEHVEEDVSEA